MSLDVDGGVVRPGARTSAPLPAGPDPSFAAVGVDGLMDLSEGDPDITVGVVDAAVDAQEMREAAPNVRVICGAGGTGSDPASFHGTAVVSLLGGRRATDVPGICPGCRVVVRPVLAASPDGGPAPQATPEALAEAIGDCLDLGLHVVNLSVALRGRSPSGERALRRVLELANARGTLVVAAAGNDGGIGAGAVTGSPGVVPVVAYDRAGRPMSSSTFGRTIGRSGLGAPGDGVAVRGPGGHVARMSGTSPATAIVTGAAALLWSRFPDASSHAVRLALTGLGPPRTTIVPPLLDAAGSARRLDGLMTGHGRTP